MTERGNVYQIVDTSVWATRNKTVHQVKDIPKCILKKIINL